MKSYHLILTALAALFVFNATAQKDTTRKQSIEFTSAYKPVLRNAVKINFAAATPAVDTSKQVLQYNIPAQQLFYSYQPIPLKPLALAQDTLPELGLRNYLKLGVGNFSTPYADAGFSFGNGKNAIGNLYANYIGSKGKIPFQQYSQMQLKGSGSYFTNKQEVYGSAAISQREYYLFGYDQQAYTFTKDDLLQRFQDIQLTAGFKNKEATETGIHYDPNLRINLFANRNRVSESSLVAELPVEKPIGDAFTLKVALKADISSFTSKDLVVNDKFSNNIFQIAPELIFKKDVFTIHAGVTPSWDNNVLSVLPNIYGEVKLKAYPFMIQAGIVGNIVKNSYRNLAAINPYLKTPNFQLNTKETEWYAGIKTSIGKHFNFSAKAAFLSYDNMPIFINDTATDLKAFVVAYESKANNLRLHADMSFISQDKFTITGGLTFNGYTGFNQNGRAWGTIPLEMNASMRWWAFKQVLLKADFKSFTGGPYILKNNVDKSISGAADLSGGIEFAVTKKISAWVEVNNIFNNRYQRWFGYPVLGLNVLGGAVLRF